MDKVRDELYRTLVSGLDARNEISDEELDGVAGGGCGSTLTCSCTAEIASTVSPASLIASIFS